jgi:AcrR family transcriptional regulator
MSAKPITDRRIARTRLALRDAMLQLMPERGWDDLKIQEICERANVGRSTFYMHYCSKDDLLSESLNDLRDALSVAVTEDSEQYQPLAFMNGLLAHMVEQRRIFKAVIGRRSGQGVERRFREMVFQLIDQDLAKRNYPKVQQQMVGRYLAGGVVDLMAWWVDAPDAPAVEALGQLIQELTQIGLRVTNIDISLEKPIS